MKINLMLAYNFCSLGLIFVLKKNNFFFHFNRTAEPDQSILIYDFLKIDLCLIYGHLGVPNRFGTSEMSFGSILMDFEVI